jgi:hypothetical protein
MRIIAPLPLVCHKKNLDFKKKTEIKVKFCNCLPNPYLWTLYGQSKWHKDCLPGNG